VLLNPEVWPDDIAISTYHFKPHLSDNQMDTRSKQRSNLTTAAEASDHGPESARDNDTTGENYFDAAANQSPITPTVQSPITPPAAEATASDMETTLLGEQTETLIKQDGC